MKCLMTESARTDQEWAINKENNATTLLLLYNISIIFQKGLSTDCQVQMKVPYGHPNPRPKIKKEMKRAVIMMTRFKILVVLDTN